MKLKDWLKHQGMSQAEFARRIDVHKSTITHWFQGKNHPTYNTYLKIKEITNGRVTQEEVCET